MEDIHFTEEILEDLIVLTRIFLTLLQGLFHLLVDTSEEIPIDRRYRRQLLRFDLVSLIAFLVIPTEQTNLSNDEDSLSYRSVAGIDGGSNCTTSWVRMPNNCLREVSGVGGVSDVNAGRGEEVSTGLEGMVR